MHAGEVFHAVAESAPVNNSVRHGDGDGNETGPEYQLELARLNSNRRYPELVSVSLAALDHPFIFAKSHGLCQTIHHDISLFIARVRNSMVSIRKDGKTDY
jgi:hypothetical protein